MNLSSSLLIIDKNLCRSVVGWIHFAPLFGYKNDPGLLPTVRYGASRTERLKSLLMLGTILGAVALSILVDILSSPVAFLQSIVVIRS